jgi:DNA-binding transcriptional MerR regulator
MAETVALPEGQEFFKLNDVCKLANVQPYMLRFWGTEFPQLEAQKTGTGQRLYDREQVGLILEIRRLLFDEGLTIAGARKRLAAAEDGETPAPRKPVRRTAAAAKRARRTTEDFDDDDEPSHGDEDEDEDGEHLEGAPSGDDDTSPAPVAAPRPRRPPAAAAPAPVSRAEVDKAVASRVQPLLATLQDVREEVASIVAELRAGA